MANDEKKEVLPPSMVGRKVRSLYPATTGVVEKWEPLSSGMCDVLVREDSGKLCWYASGSLRENDGLGPLPSRAYAISKANAETERSLEAIRASHAKDVALWPGKDIISKAIAGAIGETKARRGATS